MNARKVPQILLSSLSSKLALYDTVFRQAKMYHPDASVIGADCNPNCPAAKSVYRFKTLPPLNCLKDNELLDFLLKWKITHVIPSRDQELQYWARKAPLLQDNGIKALISSCDAIRICEDKLLFSKKIRVSGIKIIPSFITPSEPKYEKWIVKERRGSGSRNSLIGISRKEASKHASHLGEPIFQPFISGREFTAEGWINKNGLSPAVTLRWRSKVIGGESHISITFKNLDWEEKIKTLFQSIPGLKGHCLGQFIVDDFGNLNLIEINPRLGGASPLSLTAGLNSILWSLQEQTSEKSFEPFFEPIYGAKLTKLNDQVFISFPN